MRRRLLQFLLLCLILLILAAVAVQVILWTDMPRRWVLSALNENTGLRFNAASLRTGWRGRTELRDLTVSLPLERDPFLTIAQLNFTHTDLIRLAVFRSMDLDEATLEQPHILLAQDAAGAWNVARAAATIEHVRQMRAPRPAVQTFDLPLLLIREARIDIVRPYGTIRYSPITLRGTPEAGAWRFEGWHAQERMIDGQLAPQGRWPHRVELSAAQLTPMLNPWRDELADTPNVQVSRGDSPWRDVLQLPQNLSIAATWEGQLTTDGDGVIGRLQLDQLIAGEMSADGAAAITATPARTIIEPYNLRLDTAHPDIGQVRLRSGRIEQQGQQTHLIRLLAETHHAAAQIDGTWDGSLERGHATVGWTGRFDPWQADHGGRITAQFAIPAIGRRTLDATITTQGMIPQGSWEVDMQLSGHGQTWSDLAGRIATPRFDFITDEDEFDFSGFAARFTRADREVLLTHVELPSASTEYRVPSTENREPKINHSPSHRLTVSPSHRFLSQSLGTRSSVLGTSFSTPVRGRAVLNIDTLEWDADLSVREWTPPARFRATALEGLEYVPADVALLASGSAQHAELEALTIRTQEGDVTVTGTYRSPQRVASGDQNDVSPVRARAVIDMKVPDASRTLTGRLHGDFAVTGTIEPLHLLLDGTIGSAQLAWEERAIAFTHMQIAGRVDPAQAHFESEDFDLFGGSWQLSGNFERATRDAELSLVGRDAQIEDIIELIGLPEHELVSFGGAASGAVDITIPQLDLTALELTGAWTARDLQGKRFRAQSGRGKVRIAADRAFLSDMQLEHQGGVMYGSAEFDLDDLHKLVVDVNVSDWPARIDEIDLDALISGTGSLHVDLQEASAEGDLALIGTSSLGGREFGEFDLEATLEQRTLKMHNIALRTLGGAGDGSGTIYLTEADWMRSTADFQWHNIDLTMLNHLSKHFAPFTGISDGTLTVRPVDDPRPIEPLRIDVTANMREARYDAIDVETVVAEAYLGPERLMIQRATATIADGQVDLWGRLTRHDREAFTHLFVNVDRADLQQVADYLGIADQMPGRVSGWITAGGYLVGEPRMFGQGHVSLTNSDLVNLPGIDTIYNLLRVDFGRIDPTGYGEATIRLEGNSLDISRLVYFNRGTDIVGRLRIEDVRLGGESPINGLAAGVIRPLRGVDLPLIRDLDRIFGAVQTGAASVEVSGTLEEPERRAVPFREVFAALSRILHSTR